MAKIILYSLTERNGHKRSRSEDNILQASDGEVDTGNDDVIITPQLIGQVRERLTLEDSVLI